VLFSWSARLHPVTVTAVLVIKQATFSKSQNVKGRSHATKYLRKIKVNLRTKVGICISTCSVADVVCYSATWRTNLHDVCLIDGGSQKLTKKSYLKLVVGHTTKRDKARSFVWHLTDDARWWVGHGNMTNPRLKMSHEGTARVRHFQLRVVRFPCPTNDCVSYVLSYGQL